LTPPQARRAHFAAVTAITLIALVVSLAVAPKGEPALTASSTSDGPSVIAIAFGLIFALVLPGYAITRLLGHARDLSRVEAWFCVPALSMASIIIGGLAIDVGGFTLTRSTWAVFLAAVTEVALILDLILPWRTRAAATDSVPAMGMPPTAGAATVRTTVPSGRGLSGRTRMLIVSGLLAMTAVVAVMTMVVGERDAVATQPPAATAIGMVPAFATEAPGSTRTVSLYVWNGEGAPTTFTIRLTGTGKFTDTIRATVYDNSQWSGRAKVPSTGKVTAELFRPGDKTPYRTVFEDTP
jgi:Predicted membrane protein